jgi:hypothetical protein
VRVEEDADNGNERLGLTTTTKEERMSRIDWMDMMDIPLYEFYGRPVLGEDGRSTGHREFPHGDGMVQQSLTGLRYQVKRKYDALLAPEDYDRFEKTYEVPVIRNGKRGYELFDKLTLRDVPAVEDTFEVLQKEREKEKLAEAERKKAEAKERERIRAKERRKLKKLGEW